MDWQGSYELTGSILIEREYMDWQGVHGYYGLVLEKELKGKPLRSTHQWNREEEI